MGCIYKVDLILSLFSPWYSISFHFSQKHYSCHFLHSSLFLFPFSHQKERSFHWHFLLPGQRHEQLPVIWHGLRFLFCPLLFLFCQRQICHSPLHLYLF